MADPPASPDAPDRYEYRCSVCHAVQTWWTAHCVACGRPLSVEVRSRAYYKPYLAKKPWVSAAAMGEVRELPRISGGIPSVDRVLGGGFPVGLVVLLYGPQGRGKTTLLLTCLGNAKRRALYVSGEQSLGELKRTVRRIGLEGRPGLLMATTTSLEEAEAIALTSKASVVALDSAQLIASTRSRGTAGSPSQCKHLGAWAKGFAARHQVVVVIVGHVDKEGKASGTNELPHIVDAVFRFDGRERSELRVLTCAGKNREGSTVHRAVLRMTATGLHEADEDDLEAEDRDARREDTNHGRP